MRKTGDTQMKTTSRFRTAMTMAATVLAMAAPVAAQQIGPDDKPAPGTTAAATRFPAEGLAVLDCAPKAPAPADSCVLRVPPSRERDRISKVEAGAAKGDFALKRDLAEIDPALRLAETMVLIDTTPALGLARKPSWPRERSVIAEVLRGLPAGQPVALYGFSESLERLSDFTTDHEALARIVETLELRGSNTRIATSTRDAIDVLAARSSTVLRNLIVISDGQEEGNRTIAEVSLAAAEKGVTISTLGLFWRPVGVVENGSGLDYLQKLSEGTLGTSKGIELQSRDKGRVAADVAEFLATVNRAADSSGLIVPKGAPVEADITVTLRKPRAGVPGVYDEELITARFTPEALRNPPEVTPAPPAKPPAAAPAPEPWYEREWQGLKLMWWAAGGGLAAVLLIVGLVLGLTRKSAPELDLEADFPLDLPEDLPPAPPPAPNVALPAPRAWLVRTDTGERLAVRKARVSIGRSDSCELVLEDKSISRLHAELEQAGPDSFNLTDAGSLNKTRVNGKIITGAKAIKAGDTLTFGDLSVRFVLA
ncbi:hypothetical protein AP071_14455 [Rhodobacter capsulatus]|nr:hypothetical protein AP073_06545 [Rhodobacter capsulatus]KQB15355.1 hypothetical protein AP071_14455 [Rhodobacter capsulatus]